MFRPACGSCYGLIRRRWFAKLRILPGMVHGVFSMNHASDYAETVMRIVRTKDNRKIYKIT